MHTVINALPQLQLHAPCVIIGGTNGKGTTAGFLFSLLSRVAGLKVGLYTSPHVSHFCERVQVSHQSLNDDTLLDIWQELKQLLAPLFFQRLTFFECTTLLAFFVFNRTTTDINVLEVGLGGTWDAVNVCDPLASAIVSIGKDHQQYLGNTYSAILADKLGIARAHRPLFWGKQGSGADDAELQHTLQKIVAQKQLLLCSAGREFKLNRDNTLCLELPDLPTIEMPLPASLHTDPHWLRSNFSLAFALSWWLLHRLDRTVPNFVKLASHTIARLRPNLPARFQQRSLRHRHTGQERPLLLDACHNYDGMQALVIELRQRYGKVAGLLSLLNDKEIDKIVPLLAQQCRPFAVFAVDNERSMIREQLPARWQHCWHDNFATAWHSVSAKLDPQPLVICGSFYGLGEALALLAQQDEWQLL